jgi:hypothetical protein
MMQPPQVEWAFFTQVWVQRWVLHTLLLLLPVQLQLSLSKPPQLAPLPLETVILVVPLVTLVLVQQPL